MADYRAMIRDIQAAERILEDEEGEEPSAPPEVPDGCSPDALVALEARLGVALPPSYREFLARADGFAWSMRIFGNRLFGAADVAWFRETSPETIHAWTSTAGPDISEDEHRRRAGDTARFRHAYLPDLLHIGREEDGSDYLLNSLVRDASGEWEFWDLSPHHPGAARLPSFGAWFVGIWQGFRKEAGMDDPAFTESELIAGAMVEIRRRIVDDGLRPGDAIDEYLRSRESDPTFRAWKRRSSPAFALTQALRASGLG